MDYWRALQILGIDDDDGLTRTQLRRIYLRKLKDHPPERDPDGFRELREAFERVQRLVDDDPVPVPSAPAVIQVIDASTPIATPSADVFVPRSAGSSGSFASGAASRSGTFSSSVLTSASSSGSFAASGSAGASPLPPAPPDAFVPFSIPLMGAPVVPPNDNRSSENRSSEYAFRPSDSRPSDFRPSDPPVEPPRIIVTEVPRVAPPVEPPRIIVTEVPRPGERPKPAPPVEPPRILAPPPVEPPKREPPKPASNLPPLSTLREPEPPLPLSVLVPKLLQLLEAGHVQTALELEQDWRSSGDTDDYRQSDVMVAAKWSLLRELLAVVAELPVDVTRPIARALGMGKLDLCRGELEAFRRKNHYAAEAANVLLAKRAPTIYRQIEGALYQAPRVQPTPQYFSTPPSSRASGGRGALSGVGIFAVIGMAVVRFATTSSHTSSSYDYGNYKIPDIDIPKFEYHPPPINFDMPPVKTYFGPPKPYEPLDNTPETVWGSIYESSQAFTLYDIASPEQKAAASTFGNDALDQSCRRSRASLKKLDAAPFNDDADRRADAELHLAAIHRWLDVVCKPAATKKAKPKPAPKPAAATPDQPAPELPQP